MEIAIPILTLGALYVISNDKNKKDNLLLKNKSCNESFSNMDKLNPQTYSNQSTQGVDKFFGKNSKKFNNNDSTDNAINLENFKHNNMTPFFGGNIK